MGTIEDGNSLGWTGPGTALRVSAVGAIDSGLLGRESPISALRA
jgi:hypothetical protein